MTHASARTLYAHFFRRFFDNDTLSFDGDTQTSVVRSISILAVPGLMVAFWLTPHYPSRSLWAAAADHYFFVLYSFVAMGCVATFEWDMLFPDRSDFLVLLPLPLKLSEIMIAKARALAAFLGLFLLATNIFGLLLLPAISGGSYLRHVFSHFIAVSRGRIRGVEHAGARRPRHLFPQRSMATIHLAIAAGAFDSVPVAHAAALPAMWRFHTTTDEWAYDAISRYIPPFWFLGLYEHLLHGDPRRATPSLSRRSTLGHGSRRTRRARHISRPGNGEGDRPLRVVRDPQGNEVLSPPLHRTLLRKPEESAVFHFIRPDAPEKPLPGLSRNVLRSRIGSRIFPAS